MGVDPPDDPGGGPGPGPPVAFNVVIDDSSMDTEDGLVGKFSDRKRIRPRKPRCRLCNMKKRKSKDGRFFVQACQCEDSDSANSDISKSLKSQIEMQPPSHLSKPANENLSISQHSETGLGLSQPQQTYFARKYVSLDSGPFTVHVQRVTTIENDSVSLHPIQFGKVLKNLKINNIVNGSVKRIGRNRISMAFTNFEAANKFTENAELLNLSYKIFIPSFNVTRVGIVRGVPQDWSEQEIQENITVPIGCGQIVKLRRIKRKTMNDGISSFINTNLVVLTFDGQVLPKRVYMCYTALPVELYIFPTIQCYNCCKFGHTKSQCRSRPRCFKCGDEHTPESCSVIVENGKCFHCSGRHFATSRTCPEFTRQQNIKISMAHSCISYAEAAKIHPSVSKSYADVTASPPSQPSNHHLPSPNFVSQLPSTSYKKTTFSQRRVPPKPSGGYDRVMHNSIANEYNNLSTQMSHGQVLQQSLNTISHKSIAEIILELITLLTNSSQQLSTSNSSPSNVANILLTALNKQFNNGSQNLTMEL